MQKFTKLTGVAAPMDVINVDTDQIIPKLHLRTIKRTGLGKVLFDELRFDPDGTEKPGFILNREPYRKAEILVAGDNFGCGSSREHAPWALLDFGIRCVISTSFADIFYNNCFKNGILPITVSADELQALMADASDRENPVLGVDLHIQEITRPNGATVSFAIDEFRRECLLDGLDDIGLTPHRELLIVCQPRLHQVCRKTLDLLEGSPRCHRDRRCRRTASLSSATSSRSST